MRDITGFVPGQHHYVIRRLNAGSMKYGPCEVCKQNAVEIWHQVEERFYEHAPSASLRQKGWTHHECSDLFGHYECLVDRRKGPYLRTYIDTDDQRKYHLHGLPTAADQRNTEAPAAA